MLPCRRRVQLVPRVIPEVSMAPSLSGAAKLSAIVSLLLYLNSIDCGLVFDDTPAIKMNNDVLAKTGWLDLLYHDYWGNSIADEKSHKSYRPLTVATFRLNYMLHELQPLGYHLVNVLLHSAVCYLYVLLCGVVFSEVWPALIAGLLFAVHPIHTEAVAGVVGRAELLSALFFISSFLCYKRSIKKDCGWWQVASWVVMLCSLLSKEQGVTVIGVCVVYSVLVSNGQTSLLSSLSSIIKPLGSDGNSEQSKCRKRTFFTALSGVCVILLRIFLGGGTPGAKVFTRDINPPATMETPYRQLSWLYLCFVNSWLLLNPFSLCADWRFGGVAVITSLTDPLNLLTLLTLAAVSILGVWSVCGRGLVHRATIMGLLLLVLPFLPASNLFFPVGFVIAERVLYIPSMGFCMLVAYGAWNLLRKSRRSRTLHFLAKAALAFLLVTHSAKTLVRNRDWVSGISLYTSGVARNPSSGVMLSNLGVDYAIAKNYSLAQRLYRASMEAAPQYSRGFFNYGKIMKLQNIYEEAEWSLHRAIELGHYDTSESKVGEAYSHLVDVVSSNSSRLGEALELCQEATQYRYAYPKLLISWSTVLLKMNRTSEALQVAKDAVEKIPASDIAHYNLGLAYVRLNKLDRAAPALRRAISLNPRNLKPYHQLALILQIKAKGNTESLREAVMLLTQILQTSPQHTDTLSSLASLYYELKDYTKTRTTLHQVLQHNPNHTDTHYRLGVLDYVQGHYRRALQTFTKVYSLQPGYKKTKSYLELAQKELMQQRTL